MKTFRLTILICTLAFTGMAAPAHAAEGKMATADDVKMLKRDVLDGKIKIGKTRLKQIRERYGDATSINETDSRITYEYDDLRLVMDKMQYLRKWEYDYSHSVAYSDDIDELRFDLEDKQLVGEFVSYDQIRKDYGEPTEAHPTDEDGMMSVYYYGEIKLTFENVIVLNNWRGAGLQEGRDAGVTAEGVLISETKK